VGDAEQQGSTEASAAVVAVAVARSIANGDAEGVAIFGSGSGEGELNATLVSGAIEDRSPGDWCWRGYASARAATTTMTEITPTAAATKLTRFPVGGPPPRPPDRTVVGFSEGSAIVVLAGRCQVRRRWSRMRNTILEVLSVMRVRVTRLPRVLHAGNPRTAVFVWIRPWMLQSEGVTEFVTCDPTHARRIGQTVLTVRTRGIESQELPPAPPIVARPAAVTGAA
jgi:hypothetical protein